MTIDAASPKIHSTGEDVGRQGLSVSTRFIFGPDYKSNRNARGVTAANAVAIVTLRTSAISMVKRIHHRHPGNVWLFEQHWPRQLLLVGPFADNEPNRQ